MPKDTKRFTLHLHGIAMVNRPLPEILTSLVLDYGIMLENTVGFKCRKLNLHESAFFEYYTGMLTQFTIVRTN
jgi:hypothetical protein